MGYLSRGYQIVSFSPVLSIVTWVFILFLGHISSIVNVTTEPMIMTGIQILLMSIQACGLILCFVGYKKKESFSFNLHVNFLLVLWGFFTILLAWVWNVGSLISTSPPVKPLFWISMEYTAWTFTGFIWIVSGLIFTATAIIKKRSEQEPR
jgi:hypothetical protein